jgi:hypothetical protein
MAYLGAYMADIRPDKAFLTFPERAISNKHIRILIFPEAKILISTGVDTITK